MAKVKVDKEFSGLIPSHTDEEKKALRASIEKEGCRDRLVTWNGLLLDGHCRLGICDELNKKYGTRGIEAKDRNEAALWIINYQFARRNLDKVQRVKLAEKSRKYLRQEAKSRQREHGKTAPGRKKTLVPTLAQVSDNGKVRDKLADLAGVSHGTYDKIEMVLTQGSKETKKKMESGELSPNFAYSITRKERQPKPRPKSKPRYPYSDGFLKLMDDVLAIVHGFEFQYETGKQMVDNDLFDSECRKEAVYKVDGAIKSLTKWHKSF